MRLSTYDGDDIPTIDLFSTAIVTIEYVGMLPFLLTCGLASFLYDFHMTAKITPAGNAIVWVTSLMTVRILFVLTAKNWGIRLMFAPLRNCVVFANITLIEPDFVPIPGIAVRPPPGTPTQSTPPQAENHEPAHDESQPVPEQTNLVVQLPAATDVSPPTDVPPPTDDPPVAEDPVPTSESATDLDTSQILNSEGLFALRRLFSDDDEDLESAPPDSSGSSDESSDDDDDDGDDGKTTNTDDHGNSDPEMDVESQPLFSSESQPLVSSESTPAPEQERSSFGPMRSARRLSGRRQPAPMPEPLQALHRIVTAPAPVPSGRTSRAAVDPAAPPPPSPPSP